MEPRIFHGELTPDSLAEAILSQFNRNNLRTQKFGSGDQVIVQIASREWPAAGGQTALSVTLRKVEDGVAVQMGKQAWLGVVASLGKTAMQAWRNPWRLLDRLDDIAQDFEYIQLSNQVWTVLEANARAVGATFELSERLRRVVCVYCLVANPVGEPACIACGAPLGLAQPATCPNCGFVVKKSETTCPNCGHNLT